jgi:hypothetical protein
MNRGRVVTGMSILVFLLVAPMTIEAAAPDAILKMCKRDGKNTIRRMKSNIQTGASSFYNFEKTCIKGPKADQIKGLDGYKEVQDIYKEAKGMLDAAVKGKADKASAAKSSALAAGPGGDALAIRNRWKAKPDRCQSAEAWDKASGANKAKRGKARIAGMEDEESSKRIHKRVFAGKGTSGRWPQDFSADDHLARIICGKSIEGVDPFFTDRRDLVGAQMLAGDSRISLADAVTNSKADADRLVLYKAALVGECFRATAWDVKKGYVPYVYCSDAVGNPPSKAEVEAGLKKVFAGREFEQVNLLYIFSEGLAAMKEIDAAFAKMEQRYPRMKAVYRDSAVQARKRFAERRKKYSSAYQVLDPITEQLFEDPTSTPPADCESQLLKLRDQLAKELKPKNADDVQALRVGHPLGYQITEALAYCYMGQGKMAKAKLEAEALRKGNRRINLAEEIAFSRIDAMHAVEQELKSKGKIIQAIPNYSAGSYGVPLPGSVRRSPRFLDLLGSRGRYENIGEDDRKPAVIKSKKPGKDGVQLVFKKFKFTRKYRDWKCKETNKVDRYDISYNTNGTTTLKPVYRQNCWEVGPVKKQVIVYQEKPIIITPADAKLLKMGSQVTVLSNTQKKGDAALIDAWLPKKGRKKAFVATGFKVK